jgi:hypothetical protein
MIMKHKKIILSTMLAAVMIGAGTGCKKDQFDINANPDSPTDASVAPSEALPATLTATATIIDGGSMRFLQNWMGYWARSGDFQAITDEETYNFTNGFQSGTWDALYYNATNYNFVINKAKAAGYGRYEGIARIMKALDFQMLVDIYGNVPYKQAFGGINTPNPVYDKGIDIYKDLFRQLDTAITLMNDPVLGPVDANPGIAASDLVYGGNVTLWTRFANTLKLRMLVHCFAVPGFPIAAEITKINATGVGYLGTGQSAHMNPGYTTTKPSPYWRAYVASEAGTEANNIVRANSFAINYLKYNGDTFRLKKFYTPPPSLINNNYELPYDQIPATSYRGVPYGQVANSNFSGASLSTVRAKGYIPNGAASRSWLITSVESFFLQAEAIHRGILPGGAVAAENMLNTAILESFIWLGDSDPVAHATELITNNSGFPDVDYSSVGGGIYTILSQKWFALNGIATFEIWTDYRRTNVVYGGPIVGFPAGPPISVWPDNTSTIIPVRLLYPQSEYNYNAANVAAEGTINRFTSKIFWDL